MSFVMVTLRFIAARIQIIRLNRMYSVQLLRRTTLILATIPVLLLANLALANHLSGVVHFINMNWIGDNNPKELILTGNPNSYVRHSIQVRSTHNVKYRVLWYETNTSSPTGQTSFATTSTSFKYGSLQVQGGPNTQCFVHAGYACWKLHFTPNTTELNKIPIGKTVRLEFVVNQKLFNPGETVSQFEEENKLTLNIKRDNNEIEWTSGSSGTHTGQATATDFSSQNGILTTYTSDLTNLSFKSQLYDNSTTPVEATLTKSEVESTWAGEEWTTLTPYGRWVIGNETACASNPGNSPWCKMLKCKIRTR